MKPHILVVDDDPGIRKAVSLILIKTGYRVSEAEDGREALSLILNTEKDEEYFDLILTDIQMPKLTGTELIEGLRKRGIFLPIIVLTGQNDQALTERVLSHENTDIFIKPYDFEELAQRIEAILDYERKENNSSDIAPIIAKMNPICRN